jgi:thiosulfate/3-mercaptopyruvate sulfurtransferase
MKRVIFLRTFGALVWFTASGAVAGTPALVEGRWVEKNLSDKRLILVDMSEDDTQYQRFHLPGARRLPYEALVKEKRLDGAPPCPAPANGAPCAPPKIKSRLDDEAFARLLGKLGITRDHYVVIYDDLGGLNAGRLFWELERLQHPRVSVLDGGLVKWILDGRKVVNNAPAPKPTVYALPAERRANEARLEDVKRLPQEKSATLLDVRTDEEYLGEKNKLRTGHVPGARWWSWEQAVDVGKGFVRKPADALLHTLAQAGASDKNTPLIAYCRSGHRAAQTYLTLRSLGFENVKVYADSMNEYGALPDNPLKQGAQP